MQFKQIVILAFAGLVMAKGGGGNHTEGHDRNKTGQADTDRRACAEMTQLTGILDLVNNATKLAQFETRHNLSQADVDAIKAQAVNETARLKTLQSNTTLVKTCAVMEADMQLKFECSEMKQLTELSDLANNQTALQEFQAKRNLTAAEVTKFMDRAKNATAKLATLQKNSTLVNACKGNSSSQGSSSQGLISDKSNAAGRSMTAGGMLQVVSSTVFVAVLTALIAGLQ